jgi:hypothetical protein
MEKNTLVDVVSLICRLAGAKKNVIEARKWVVCIRRYAIFIETAAIWGSTSA